MIHEGDILKIKRTSRPITVEKVITPTLLRGRDNLQNLYIFSVNEITKTSLEHLRELEFSREYMHNASRMTMD